MRNVNIESTENTNIEADSFILTMRNVNVSNVYVNGTSLTGFILTMRNVNQLLYFCKLKG